MLDANNRQYSIARWNSIFPSSPDLKKDAGTRMGGNDKKYTSRIFVQVETYVDMEAEKKVKKRTIQTTSQSPQLGFP